MGCVDQSVQPVDEALGGGPICGYEDLSNTPSLEAQVVENQSGAGFIGGAADVEVANNVVQIYELRHVRVRTATFLKCDAIVRHPEVMYSPNVQGNRKCVFFLVLSDVLSVYPFETLRQAAATDSREASPGGGSPFFAEGSAAMAEKTGRVTSRNTNAPTTRLIP
jgi:hypothetical protein